GLPHDPSLSRGRPCCRQKNVDQGGEAGVVDGVGHRERPPAGALLDADHVGSAIGPARGGPRPAGAWRRGPRQAAGPGHGGGARRPRRGGGGWGGGPLGEAGAPAPSSLPARRCRPPPPRPPPPPPPGGRRGRRAAGRGEGWGPRGGGRPNRMSTLLTSLP